MHALINTALNASRKATVLLRDAISRPDLIKVSEKGRNDFVTDIDKAVEDTLIYHISKAYPDHGFICEESGEKEGKESDTYWIIDPIDGTRNFILGLPHFCISIACVQNGQLSHALIVDPVREEEFTASKGSGARLNGKRLRVSDRQFIEGGTLSMSCAGLKNYDQMLSLQKAMQGNIGALRMTGSAALDLAYAAAGRTDGGWMSGMKVWDCAAGILLIRESGGLISDSKGNPDCLHGDDLVFSNNRCFKPLLKWVADSAKP